MLRTFTTHRIRKQTELSGRTWNFTPLGENVPSDSFPVVVPSCWESYPGFENYRGIAEYETTFEGEGNVALEFKGVAHQAWIFVDGMEVGSHYNAYTPFRILLRISILRVCMSHRWKRQRRDGKPDLRCS